LGLVLSLLHPSDYARKEEYEGERGQRGRGKSVSLPMSLKFDGKSNWKAFYAKFSRYAEVSEWTEGEGRVHIYHFLVPLNQEGIIFTCFPIQAPA
jgi:hypothetical protein